MEFIAKYQVLFSLGINLAIGFGLWIWSAALGNRLIAYVRVKDLNKSLDERDAANRLRDDAVRGLDHRVTVIEASIEHMPTKESLHELALTVRELKGEMMRVGAELKGHHAILTAVSSRVEVMDQFLRERGQ